LSTFWGADIAAGIDYSSGGYPFLVGNTITYVSNGWTVSCTGTIGASFSSINDLTITDTLTGQVWDIEGTLNYSSYPWLSTLTSGTISEASISYSVGAGLTSVTRLLGSLTYSGGAFSGAITEIDNGVSNNAGTLYESDTGFISVYTSPNSTTASGTINSGSLEFIVNGALNGFENYSNANFSISQSPSQLLQGNDYIVLSGALGSTIHAGAGNDIIVDSSAFLETRATTRSSALWALTRSSTEALATTRLS
jgi:hypothetical protein